MKQNPQFPAQVEEKRYHFCHVSVGHGSLTLQAIAEDGTVLDSLRLADRSSYTKLTGGLSGAAKRSAKILHFPSTDHRSLKLSERKMTLPPITEHRSLITDHSPHLELYLFSYRNHGAFHEQVVNLIMDDIVAAISPRRIVVEGEFNPRGGISIHVHACGECDS